LGGVVDKSQVNPWSWQEKLGFSHAWRVDGAQSVIFLAGQGPVTADGQVLEGDFESQARLTFENMQEVLRQAGATFDSVVKLTAYFTDISNLRDYGRVRNEFIVGNSPASTALEVAKLALPGMTIEVEAIAVL
jgi:enamine deaminase RidA (YjgF/YER057c/UK114 family)